MKHSKDPKTPHEKDPLHFSETEQEKNKEPGSEPTKVIPLSEYESLTARIKELEGLREKLLLAAADFENAKKRLARDKEDFLKFAQDSLLRDLLPILDNLERSLTHSKEDESTLKQVVRGVEMVSKQFLDTLKKQGLQKFGAVGDLFDPHRHEAVAVVEEAGKDHEIIDVIEPGYLLHDRVLRVAKVRIRIAPSSPKADASSES